MWIKHRVVDIIYIADTPPNQQDSWSSGFCHKVISLFLAKVWTKQAKTCPWCFSRKIGSQCFQLNNSSAAQSQTQDLGFICLFALDSSDPLNLNH